MYILKTPRVRTVIMIMSIYKFKDGVSHTYNESHLFLMLYFVFYTTLKVMG